MSFQLDLRLVELLCSRLCHDLVGPIGAVNNGIELLEDFDPAIADEVLPLVTGSARQAWRRLDFFRVAFGFGGGRSGWSVSELRRYAGGLLEQGKVALEWPDDPARDAIEIEARASKLLLNLVLLGSEALPRGGSVAVAQASTPSELHLTVTAAGSVAALHEQVQAVLDRALGPDEIEARTVQAYFTVCLADDLGAALRVQRSDGRLALTATISA